MYLYIFLFILGLCVGSFLNVLIDRLPKGESILGRSYCPYCKKKLEWYELVPLFSFIFLKGKCRACKRSISWQYPFIELTSGLLFTFTYYLLIVNNQWSPVNFLFYLFFTSLLIVIFTTDLKYYIVSDKIVFLAIVLALFYQIYRINQFSELLNPIISAISASVFFYFFVGISGGKWMGMGDVKIAGFMGILLAFPNVLIGLAVAFLSGAVVGLILVAMKKKGLKSEIPFGCFLAPATYIAIFFGGEIIEWYLNLII
mgnify:CR=1 FL=1